VSVGGRREARERALGLLYEAESKGISGRDLLADLPVEPDQFAVEIVAGVGEQGPEIDALISRFAKGWTIERMPALDRAVLRMATFELLARRDVPTNVVLNEAVELASQYSTDESGRFVNGLLAAIAAEVRPSSDGDPAP
jgi:N utilization substance protein B